MEENNTYNNFIFRDKWWTALQGLDPETLGKVMRAICAYAFEGTEPNLTVGTAEWMACTFIMADMKTDKERYDNVIEKRREAGRKGNATRWSEKPKDEVANATNVSQSIANVANVTSASQNIANIANATFATNKNRKPSQSIANVAVDVYVDDDVYVDEEDTTSTPKPSPSVPVAVEEKKQEEREEVVFDYALQLLEEGRLNAYTESSQAYDHNEALGWKREITRSNGTTEKQEIQNKRAWLRKRPPKNEQIIPPDFGILLAAILRRVGCSERNKSVIDDFRGVRIRDHLDDTGQKTGEDEVIFLYTKRQTCALFKKQYDSNAMLQAALNEEVRKVFPKAEYVSFEVPPR